MNTKLAFLSSILITFLFLNIVLGSVFIYLSSDIQVSSSAPDVTFIPTTALGVTTILGANSTSANITVKASTAPYEITINGRYDAGPSPWTLDPGTYITNAVWYPTLLGRTGVMNISGNAFQTGFFTVTVLDWAYLTETITWPSTSITSANLIIDYRIRWASPSIFGIVEYALGYEIIDSSNVVIDWNLALVFQGANLNGDTNWNTLTFTLNPALFTPGENYLLRITLYFRVIALFSIDIYFEYLLDQSVLIVTPSKPTFTGVVLNLNSTVGIYNVSLYLNSINAIGNANVSIWLRNYTASVDSTKISIENSLVINPSTSELLITPVPPGFLSLSIILDTVIDVGASITLNLTLKYRLYDGVYVEYPITITIVDPPYRDGSSEYPVPDKPIKLVIYGDG